MVKTEVKTLIITGGAFQLGFAMQYLLDMSFDYIISVDGGLFYIDELHMRPDYLIGDFDTVDPDLLKKYLGRREIKVERFSPIKDKTDTELAIDLAIELKSTHVKIMGALGNREDHAFMNILLLEKLNGSGIKAEIVDEKNLIFVADHSFSINTKDYPYTYISFFSLTESVTGLTLEGFKYNLQNKKLLQGSSLCVSNEMTEKECRVSLSEGRLLVMLAKD